MKTPTTTVRTAAAVAMILTLATACGTPQSGDRVREVVVAYSTDVDTLDPHQFKSESAYAVGGNIYGTLLQEDYAEAEGGLLDYTGTSVPYLAQTATWNDTQNVLTLVLRDGLTFGDGSPIVAGDVIYSLRRAMSDVGYVSAISPWLNIADPATDIVAVDDATVEIRVSHYSALIEQFLAFQIFAVMDESAAASTVTNDDPWAAGFFAQNATASGPYTIDSRVEGQSVTLVQNERFDSADLTDAPQTVVVQTVPDAQQAFLALQNGAVDVVSGLTPDVAEAVQDDPELKVYDLDYSDIAYMGFNNDDPLLSDVRVRQAISYLVPYEALRNDVMKGYAGTAVGPTPYPMQDALDETGDADAAYNTDAAKAEELLAAAGITDLSLTLSVPTSDETLRQSAVFIQSALSEAGISVTVNELNDAEFNANLGQMQMYLDTWYSWGQDSVYQLYFLLTTGQYTNYTNYTNADVDQLVSQAMATSDPVERAEYSKRAQQIVIDEAPWAFLYTRDLLIGTQSNVSGITHSNDGNLRFDRLRIDE